MIGGKDCDCGICSYCNGLQKWPPGWTLEAIKELVEASKVILPNIDQPVPYEDYRRFQKALIALEKP